MNFKRGKTSKRDKLRREAPTYNYTAPKSVKLQLEFKRVKVEV